MGYWQDMKAAEVPNLQIDATGNPIKLGRMYGFSNDSSGVTTTTVGKAVKFNEKSVTIEIAYRQTGLWTNAPDSKDHKIGKKSAVKAMKLFPMHDVNHPDEDLFDKDFLKEIGFETIKDNGKYGEAHSIRPKGKIILNWNKDGANCDYFGTPEPRRNSFLGIKEDGGTRTTFNGIVYTREQIELLIKLSC